jgi:hypothetical protein
MSTLQKLGQSFSQKALGLTAGVAVGGMMLGLGAFVESASAVNIAGYEIDERGFADTLINSGGSLSTPQGGSISTALTDRSLLTSVVSQNPATNPFVTLGFLNNPVVNEAGKNDLVFFELGSIDFLDITINGILKTVITEWITGETLGTSPDRNINAVEIDLDDFGISAGQSITEVKVGLGTRFPFTNTTADLALVASLNTQDVPEPSAIFGLLATFGFIAYQQKQKLTKKA